MRISGLASGLALALALAFTVTACGGGGGDGDDDSTSFDAGGGSDAPQADAPQADVDAATPPPDAGIGPDAAPFSVALIRTEPPSPAADPTPDVIGAAGAGCVTAEIYRDMSTLLGSGPVSGGGFTINVAVPVNAQSVLTARCRDDSGNPSPFSEPLIYTHDDIPPAPPVIVGTSPAPPSAERRPTVTGTVGSADCAIVQIRDLGGTIYGEDLAGVGTFSVALTADLPAETTTSLVARCIDLAGNVSGNSNAFAYTHTSSAPGTPMITGSTPASPSSNPTPTILGVTGGGTCVTVEVVQFGGGVLGSGAPSMGMFAVPVTVPANATTDLRARCLDAGGAAGGLSGPYLYTHDGVPPAAPTITGTMPASPSSSATPSVLGTAPADCATVTIVNGGGATLGSGAPAAGTFSVSVTVAMNAATELRARCTDAAGNVSGDSTPVTYVHDGIAPAAPAITGTTPASPSSSAMPQVNGTASDPDCVSVEVWNTTMTLATTTPSGGAWSVIVTVAMDATTSLRARCLDAAGNASAFSATLDYVHSSTIAGPPTLTGTSPASPSNNAMPDVLGTAPTTGCAFVEIWNDMTVKLAEGAPAGGTFSVKVTVPSNATTVLRGRCRSSAGVQSDFSAPLSYTHDGIAPPAPQITGSNPPSPSNSTTPQILGTSSSLDCAIAEIWTGTGTMKLGEGPVTSGTFAVTITVAVDTTTSVRARCRDLAGNTSGLSLAFNYVNDSMPPPTPTLVGTNPPSPSFNPTPAATGMTPSGGCSYIEVWNDMTVKLAESSVSALTTYSIPTPVPTNTSTALRTRCRDVAGNVSGFTAAYVYTHDDIPPSSPPQILDTMPTSPGNDQTPDVYGIVFDSTCTTVEVWVNGGTYKANATVVGGSWTATPMVAANTTNYVKARCKDAAGNVTAWTDEIIYVHDSNPPTATAVAGSIPASPSTSNTPLVYGNASSADCAFIDVYISTTNTLLGTTSRPPDGNWSLTITVPTNATTSIGARCRDLAGNQSGYGGLLSYKHDDTPPGQPAISSTNPTSPSSNPSPTVTGTKPTAGADCPIIEVWDHVTGMMLKEATFSASSSSWSMMSVPVPTNTTTLLKARCRDGAGNIGEFSGTFTYVHDDIPPGVPTIESSVPVSPGSDTSPDLYGSSPGAGCWYLILGRSDGWTAPTPQMIFESTSWVWFNAPIYLSNSTTYYRARCRDLAGNLSDWSALFPYTHVP